MATHLSNDLQKAIYDTLMADATLVALVGSRIYDSVPEKTVYPFIKIGDDDIDDWGSHSHHGFQGQFKIHVWAQGKGKKSTRTVQNRIWSLIHDVDLGLTGRQQINVRCNTQTIVTDQDQRTYNGVQIFDFMFGGD